MGIIGKYDPASIRYGDYDPDSPLVFKELKGIILAALPQAPLEHVGSSAVAGLSGKNIIDIALSVKDRDLQGTLSKLAGLGFQMSGLSETHSPLLLGSIVFKAKYYGIHVYVRERDSNAYKLWVFFRDYLKRHPGEARRYEGVKRESAERTAEYEAAKQRYINSVIRKAPSKDKKKSPEPEAQFVR